MSQVFTKKLGVSEIGLMVANIIECYDIAGKPFSAWNVLEKCRQIAGIDTEVDGMEVRAQVKKFCSAGSYSIDYTNPYITYSKTVQSDVKTVVQPDTQVPVGHSIFTPVPSVGTIPAKKVAGKHDVHAPNKRGGLYIKKDLISHVGVSKWRVDTVNDTFSRLIPLTSVPAGTRVKRAYSKKRLGNLVINRSSLPVSMNGKYSIFVRDTGEIDIAGT